MMSSSLPLPLVQVEFSLPGVSLSSSSSAAAAVSSSSSGSPQTVVSISQDEASKLPFDPNLVSPEAASSNTSFHYSGRHDFGTISPLRSEGYYRDLVAALQHAKQTCDTFILQHEEAGAPAAPQSSKVDLSAEHASPEESSETAPKKAKQG